MSTLCRLFTVLLVSLLTSGFAYDNIVGHVGQDKGIKIEKLTPSATVMKDAAGADVLVVFYRSSEQKKKHKIGFSVARALDERGMLIWDEHSYALPDTTLTAGNVPPLPTYINHRLYLFGTQKVLGHRDGNNKIGRIPQSNRVLYNSFATVEDLINGSSAVKELMLTHYNHHTLAGTSIRSAEGQEELLLAFYPPNRRSGEPEAAPYHYALCTALNAELACHEREASRGLGRNHIDSMTLYNLNLYGEEHPLLAVRDKYKHKLTLHRYDVNSDQWTKLYDVGYVTPAPVPISFVEKDNQLVAFYKNDNAHNSYADASIMRVQVSSFDVASNYGAASWLNPMSMYENNSIRIKTDTGVNALRFKDHIYVFYRDKDKHYARYFKEQD